ncbi:E3 ubiquitin-protein ligase TRIM21-like [Seriola lalandi dorsalis]|uniref:E3 ubiquitin-protein ligase TRIM21-like n=1 Tax=Seriola lalandi dorsalis TaxID=1841481 RepID=A0A3B4XNS9_SERLL|nr:E3 ubiquitin-protein ligase TRIM21-like [Seriola lalandi dorsalis]
MSAATCLLSEESFLCSVCLDVFNTPVSLQCGHNFCRSCITQNWRINRKCQCPVCKKRFDTSHELHVNIFISEMVAQFRESAVKTASEVAKPGEVPCDMCTGVKLKALKSCLVCLASYCETHLQQHQTVSGLKRHKLMDPLDNLEDRICTKHNELLELFCKTEQMCVCQFCNESDHETHDVVPLSEECEGRKTDLERTQAGFQQMIQERELKIQELRRSAEISKAAADKETADGVHVFSDLMQFAETGLAELSEQIKKKQKMTAKSAEGFIKELDQEISELMKRNSEAQQLSCSDHFHLLQNFSSLNTCPNTKDWNKVSLHQPSFEGAVARAVAQLRETLNKVTTKLLESELKRVQQCAVDVTLDPNTAHPKLILSDDGKQVNHSDVEKNLPDNPERFSYCVMVLGKQSFSSGRFYYEVEVKGKTKWDLGVTSVSANRKGQVTSSPEAGYWTLQLRNGNEYVALADPDVVLSLKSQPQKVGVFVDYEEGLVSFYDVDAADIIYSFTGCSFPNKLLPFFSPCFNDGGNNSAPLRISIVQLN